MVVESQVSAEGAKASERREARKRAYYQGWRFLRFSAKYHLKITRSFCILVQKRYTRSNNIRVMKFNS
jgi:hypothetical protein